jgi:hypothetical protein
MPMTPMPFRAGAALLAAALLAAPPARAAEPTIFRADPPPSILTPDSVTTRAGVLRFRDGAPDAATAQLAYDQLDLARGIEAFMKGMPATSVFAACRGLAEVGIAANAGFAITETLMDARSLFLTPNTTTPYVLGCLDLSAGPTVLEVPPGVLGPVDDAYFRWVTDVGLTGPDAGKGGAYTSFSIQPVDERERLGDVAARRAYPKPGLHVELRERARGDFLDKLVDADAAAPCQQLQPLMLRVRKSDGHRAHCAFSHASRKAAAPPIVSGVVFNSPRVRSRMFSVTTQFAPPAIASSIRWSSPGSGRLGRQR